MIHLPSRYNGNNIHRVVITQQTLPGTDYERLQDLAADAVAEARAGVAAFEAFPNGASHTLLSRFRAIKQATERRNVLVDAFFDEIPAILSHLERLGATEDDAVLRNAALQHFRRALDLAHRVKDLVAAEKEIIRSMDLSR